MTKKKINRNDSGIGGEAVSRQLLSDGRTGAMEAKVAACGNREYSGSQRYCQELEPVTEGRGNGLSLEQSTFCPVLNAE